MPGHVLAIDRTLVCWQRFFRRSSQHHRLRWITAVLIVVIGTSAIHTGHHLQSLPVDSAAVYSGFILRNPASDALSKITGSDTFASATSGTTSRVADRNEPQKPMPAIMTGLRSQPSTAGGRERPAIANRKMEKTSQESMSGLRIMRRSGPRSAPGYESSSSQNMAPEIHTTSVRHGAPDITSSTNADYHYHLALDFLKNDQLPPADEQLRQALASDPHHEQARLTLAEMLIRQKRIAEAQMIVFEGIAYATDQLPFVIELAKIYLEKGDVDRARNVLEQYEDAPEGNASYFGLLAAVYQRSGKHELALPAFEKALRLDPREARWWLGFGISLEKTGNLQSAATAYRRVIESPSATPAILKWVRNRLAVLRPSDNQPTAGAAVNWKSTTTGHSAR